MKQATHLELLNLDKAFINSILSYSVYSDRQWAVDFNENMSNEENQKEFLSKAGLTNYQNVDLKKTYEVFLSLFSRETFEKVNLAIPQSGTSFGYNDSDFNFSYENGNYVAHNNIAKASVFRSKNPDGTYSLHLSFRGTDQNVKSLLDYVSQAYIDMEEYYKLFKPLKKAVLEYAKDPKNNISNIQVNGHSLGGAMVQAFFNSEDVKKESLILSGYTYGAPGAVKNFFKKQANNLVDAVNGLTDLTFGIKLIKNFKRPPIDNRITQFTHNGDLIPKIGGLAYDSIGEHVRLKDSSSKNFQEQLILSKQSINSNINHQKRPGRDRLAVMKSMVNYHQETLLDKCIDYLKNRFALKHHDMLRYIFNIESHTKKIIYDNNLSQNEDYLEKYTKNLKTFTGFRRTFSWEVSKHQQSDPISQHFQDSRYKKMTANGETIYKLPPKVNEAILEMRKKSFADKVNSLAINGLKSN